MKDYLILLFISLLGACGSDSQVDLAFNQQILAEYEELKESFVLIKKETNKIDNKCQLWIKDLKNLPDQSSLIIQEHLNSLNAYQKELDSCSYTYQNYSELLSKFEKALDRHAKGRVSNDDLINLFAEVQEGRDALMLSYNKLEDSYVNFKDAQDILQKNF